MHTSEVRDGIGRVINRLLDRMERDLLDVNVPTSELLRSCVLLGGQAGSAALRDWARLELDGYVGATTAVPRYRTTWGVLMLDGVTSATLVSQQPIDPAQLQLPDELADLLRGPVELAQPLAELEKLAGEGVVKISPPGMTGMVALANHRAAQDGQAITSLYWTISPAAIAAVVDRVRTQLTALTAELRSMTPAGQAVPSSASADRAIQVVIHGDQRGPISIQQGIRNTVGIPTPAASMRKRVVAFLRASWGWLVGLATLLGLYVATATWQGWKWPLP